MFEQLGSIHPLLPPVVGVLALLAGAVIINLIAKHLLVGTFRAYAYNYLKNHPKVHKGMTLIVRQLGPGPEGLPLEIY